MNYKENILRKASFEHLLKKQTGGSGQYAGVMGFIEPVGDGSRENIFDNRCTGTNIPSQFYSAIEKGFQEGLKEGPLAGCAIEGVRFVGLQRARCYTNELSGQNSQACANRFPG